MHLRLASDTWSGGRGRGRDCGLFLLLSFGRGRVHLRLQLGDLLLQGVKLCLHVRGLIGMSIACE